MPQMNPNSWQHGSHIGRLGQHRALRETTADFRRDMAQELRRSDLENFLTELENSTVIMERNVVRTSDLVTSFKRVAVDRTTSLRRRFPLRAVLDKTILTLRPSLRLSPVA